MQSVCSACKGADSLFGTGDTLVSYYSQALHMTCLCSSPACKIPECGKFVLAMCTSSTAWYMLLRHRLLTSRPISPILIERLAVWSYPQSGKLKCCPIDSTPSCNRTITDETDEKMWNRARGRPIAPYRARSRPMALYRAGYRPIG